MTVKVFDFGHKLVRTYHNCTNDEARRIEFAEMCNGYKVEITG